MTLGPKLLRRTGEKASWAALQIPNPEDLRELKHILFDAFSNPLTFKDTENIIINEEERLCYSSNTYSQVK